MAPRTENSLTQPDHVDTSRVVEGTYSSAGGGPATQEGQEKYLNDRFSRRVQRRNRRTGERVPYQRLVTRIRKGGWSISPLQSVSLTVAGLALANAAVNTSTLVHEVQEFLGTRQTLSHTITSFGPTGVVERDISASINFPAGATTISGEGTRARAVVGEIKKAERQGFRVIDRRGEGSASADWLGEIGYQSELVSVPVSGNTQDAQQRIHSFEEAIDEAAKDAGVNLPQGSDSSEVVAIPKSGITDINAELARLGLPPL